jgi:rhamnosyl/mannosyltransferase
LKILQIGKYYPPVRGGIEMVVQDLCRRLSPRHDVTALVFNTRARTTTEAADGARLIRVATWGKILSTEISPSFVPWIRRLRADVVHMHMPNPVGELGALLSAEKTPLVLTYHSDVVRQRWMMAIYGPLLDAVLRRADRIIVSSRRYMESSEPLRPYRDKCAIIPLGLDFEAYAVTPEVEERARVLRREHGERIVAFVGRLVYYKGVEHLLAAARGLDATVLVAGDGPMRPALEAESRRRGLESRVRFLGEISHEEKLALYRAAALTVLPATHRSEAFGLVQVEAHACGRPVVSTNLDSGVPFVNLDGVTGLVVPPSDSEALAGAIGRLLDDPDLRERFGAAASERARREFSVEGMVKATEALYEEVLRARGSRGCGA